MNGRAHDGISRIAARARRRPGPRSGHRQVPPMRVARSWRPRRSLSYA